MAIPTIIQRIVLQGVEDIEQKLRGLGTTGEKAFRQIQNAGNATANSGRAAEQQLQNIGRHTLEHAGAVGKLREGLHILHPLLRSTGLEFGNLRALSSLAGAGLGAFAGVVTTVALIALEKLQDSAETAKQRLQDLAKFSIGPPTTGTQEFEKLEPAARRLRTTPTELAVPYGAALQAGQQQSLFLQGFPQATRDQLRDAQANLIFGARADRATEEEAAKSTTGFFGKFSRGALTPEALGELPEGERNKLATALLAQRGITKLPQGVSPGGYFQQGLSEHAFGGDFTLKQTTDAINKIGPEFEDAFKKMEPQLSDGIGAIEGALKDLAEQVGKIGLAKYLQDMATAIETFTANLNNNPFVQGAKGGPPPKEPATINRALGYGLGEGARYSGAGTAVGAGIGAVGGSFLFPGAGTIGGALAGAEIGAAIPPAAAAAYEAGRHLLGAGVGQGNISETVKKIEENKEYIATGKAGGGEITSLPLLSALRPFFGQTAGSEGFTQQIGAPAPQSPAADERATSANTSEIADNTAEANRILDAINSKMKPAAAPAGGGTGFAVGGTISGPGTGTSDSIVMPLEVGGFILRERVNRAMGYAEGGHVMARVSAGERYFQRAEVQKIGLPVLQKLNAMSGGGAVRLPAYADGDEIVDADTKATTTTISTEELTRLNREKFDTPRENIPDAQKSPPPFVAASPTSLGVPHPPYTSIPMPLVAGQPGFSYPLQPGQPGYSRPSVYGEVGQPIGPPIHYQPPAVEAEQAAAYAQSIEAAKVIGQDKINEARREEKERKAVVQFQKRYAAYRAREHSAGDVGAARARVFGGDPGPSQHMENLIPGYGLDLRNVFQYAEGGDVNNNWNWDWQKREPETKTVSDISGKATFSYPVMPSMADGGLTTESASAALHEYQIPFVRSGQSQAKEVQLSDERETSPNAIQEPRAPLSLNEAPRMPHQMFASFPPKFAQGGMVDDAMGNLWRAWAPERKINPATFLSVPGIGIGSPWSKGAKDVPAVPPQEHKIGGIVLPHFEVALNHRPASSAVRQISAASAPIIVAGLDRGGIAALPMPPSPRAPAGISDRLEASPQASVPSAPAMAPMAIGGITMAAPAIPRLPTGGIVLPRFDIGGSVATVAPPPTIPSMGDEAIDFSSMSSSRGVRSAPTIDPTFSGQTHVIDWRVNGEPVARGRGDDALIDSLKRISVRDQSRRAGKASSWVGS